MGDTFFFDGLLGLLESYNILYCIKNENDLKLIQYNIV